MNLKKTTLVTLAVLSIMGCSQNEEIKNSDTLIMSQMDIDLMIQRAKVEERERIAKLLEQQEKKKKVFDEMLIARGEPPRFSEYYKNIVENYEQQQAKKLQDNNQNQNQAPNIQSAQDLNFSESYQNSPKVAFTDQAENLSNTTLSQNQDSDVNSLVRVLKVDASSSLAENRVMNAEGGISKIIPDSRMVREYRTVNGVTYYSCAANSVAPKVDNQGQITYQANVKELSATLCKKSRDKATMLELQEKLYSMGYLQSDTLTYEQLVDGIWGDSTLEAVKQYQIDNGLLLGQMTIQTLEHIGVFSNPQIIDTPQSTETLLAATKEPITATAVDSAMEMTKTPVEPVKPVELGESLEPVKQLEVDQAEQLEQVEKVEQSTRVIKAAVNGDKVIINIKPESRKPAFYAEVGGAKYYRCAANSYVPIKVDDSWDYSSKTEELSATLCKRSRDAATMTDLQYELYEQGYMPANGTPVGRLISGQWDQRTLAAVKRYQKANGLLLGQLTIETLEHLGIFKPDAERLVSASQFAKRSTSLPSQVNQNEVMAETTEIKAEQRVPQARKEAVIPVAASQEVAEEVPFVALKVRLADASFDAANTVPQSAEPQVYAYVNKFKLMRCRARSVLPQLTADGEMVYLDNKEFRATLCKANRSIKLITRLQAALRDLGYLKPLPPIDRVVVDGIWGINTLTALKAYQKDNGLAYGQLTIESLEHLGVFVTE